MAGRFGGPDFFGIPNLPLGEALFLAEEEGETSLATTRKAYFNEALKEIKEECAWAKGTDIDVSFTVDRILEKHGISPSSLTKGEVGRIQRAIA